MLVIYFILLGLNAKYMEAGTYNGTGKAKVAAMLSYGGTLAGSPFGVGLISLFKLVSN